MVQILEKGECQASTVSFLPALFVPGLCVDANYGVEQRSLLRQKHLQGSFGDYTVKKCFGFGIRGVGLVACTMRKSCDDDL